MTTDIDYDDLDGALRRCGSNWDAAQAHGMLSSRLAIAGTGAGFDWLQTVLEGTDPANALRAECEVMLSDLFETAGRQLSERMSEFSPLLPDDADAAETRAEALGRWCEGYLHGLVSGGHEGAMKERLSTDPIADIIKDMLEITRATSGEGDEEDNEDAYTELVEYLRVAAQLVYEELADLRTPKTDDTVVH
ncbi:MAG: UPF0149 family protein [Woeseiaceae bacterium]|nr:UPF0149 family protein [Woeseiaceae bacterium]